MSAKRELIENIHIQGWIEVEINNKWVWKQVRKIEKNNNEIIITFYGDLVRSYLNNEKVVFSKEVPFGIPNRINVIDWDEYFLRIVDMIKLRAKCRRRQVGAVLVDADHRIFSTGYNGFPAGTDNDCLSGGCPRGLTQKGEIALDSPYTDPDSKGFCPALHAEANAILFAGKETKGSTIYITDKPCPDCQRLLAGAGIVRAVWKNGELNPMNFYKER